MANNKLILRRLNSPWTTPTSDFTKGTVLTHDDVDNNFIYIRGEIIYSANIGTGGDAGNIVLTKINGDKLYIPFSGGTDYFVTGGTYDNNTALITLDRNDTNSVTIDLSTLKSYVNTQIAGITTDNILSGTTNFFITDGDKGDITVSNSGQTWTIDSDALIYTTGATLVGNTIYFDRTDGLAQYNVDLSTFSPTGITTDNILSGTTNFFITDGDKGDITVSNSGQTWTIDADALKYTTGTTLVGTTLYFDRSDLLSAFTADLSSISGGVSADTYTTGTTIIGNIVYFDRTDGLGQYSADLSGLVPTGITTDNILSGTTNFFITDGDKGDITVSNSGTTWTIDADALVYTTGSTLIGNTIYFDRTDVLSAYTADLSSLVSSLTLTDGNGTTANGTAVDLGGVLTSGVVISGNSQTFDLGVSTSQLSFFRVNAIQASEEYSVPGQGLTIQKNPGGINALMDATSVNGTSSSFNLNPGNVELTSFHDSGTTRSYLLLGEANSQLTVLSGGSQSGLILNTGLDAFIFLDSRATTKGLEYAADYSSGYTPDSLITLRDLNLATTGLTDYYTTGTTLVGTTLYFDRTDTLSAYTADLSSIAGGGSGEANTASNIGGGEGLFSGKSGVDLQFKSLTSTGGTIAISSTGATVNLEAGNTNDPNAIHDNVNSEISAITAKSALTDTDIFLIEDSSDSNSKKQTTLGDIKDAIGSATGGTPGIQTAVENFYIATANNQAATTGSQYSSKVIPLVNRTVSNMAYFVASASASRTVYVGIYDNAGNKLAEGSGNTDATGIRTATLNTSVDLVANTEYFFSILEGSGVPNFAQTSTFGIDKLARSLFISTTPTGLSASIAGHTAATSSFWLKAF